MNKFNNLIFTTRTVKEELPEEVLLFIICLVQNLYMEFEVVDFLQVIKITGNTLIHRQEEPEYRKVYTLFTNIQSCKLFFIDNGKYSTLMFSYEY